MAEPFTKDELKIFKYLASCTQGTLLSFMSKFLRKYYGNNKVTTTPDYIIAKGKIPIGLVAHLDTVFPPVKKLCYDKQRQVVWNPEGGLGADDRAGIFAIMQLIHKGLRPTVFLTTFEEKGGIGASKLAKEVRRPHLKYLIELDRHGSNDCVFYDVNTPEFIQYIETFGFKEALGSFSDINILCEAWRICGVNLSIGYENEHTSQEFLQLDWLSNTIARVEQMLKCPAKTIPNFQYSEYTKEEQQRRWLALYNSYYPQEQIDYCAICGLVTQPDELISIMFKDGSKFNLCLDCCDYLNLELCPVCGQVYEAEAQDTYLMCPRCKVQYLSEEGDDKENVV